MGRGSMHETPIEIRGALVRGLIDYIARTSGMDGAGAVLEDAGLSNREVFPDVWYGLETLEDLLELQAEREGVPVKKVALQAGRRMAASSLDDIEDAVAYLPPQKLVARLDRFIRVGDRRAIRVDVDGDEVHVTQDPPAGPIVCPLFHGMVEGLIEHLGAAGRIDRGDAGLVQCQAEGDDHCRYSIDWGADAAA